MREYDVAHADWALGLMGSSGAAVILPFFNAVISELGVRQRRHGAAL